MLFKEVSLCVSIENQSTIAVSPRKCEQQNQVRLLQTMHERWIEPFDPFRFWAVRFKRIPVATLTPKALPYELYTKAWTSEVEHSSITWASRSSKQCLYESFSTNPWMTQYASHESTTIVPNIEKLNLKFQRLMWNFRCTSKYFCLNLLCRLIFAHVLKIAHIQKVSELNVPLYALLYQFIVIGCECMEIQANCQLQMIWNN